MKSWGEGSRMFGVFLFSSLLCPFLPPRFLPQPSPARISPGAWGGGGYHAEGWILPPPLWLFLPAPSGLTWATVVSGFHSACWCFKDSWLRGREATSGSSLGTEVMRLGWVSFLHCQGPPGLRWGPPFVSSRAPTIMGPRPCFYTSGKPRAKGFPSSWPK